jgi:UDP-glucose 4-epimerase
LLKVSHKTLKRVLVTGGAGFIGSHLSRGLIGDGYQVTIADNLSTGSMRNVPSKAEFVKVDLTDSAAVRDLPAGPYSAVCHLAGQSSGERSFDDPLYDLDANARSTLLLARWSLENGVAAFLHASSMSVYGDRHPHPVSESVIPQPTSFYGASKYSAEQILKVVGQQGLRTCSFRMFSVYGPGQNLADLKQGMVSIYLAFLLRGEPLAVRGSLKRVRDFVYIDDVAAAWRLAVENPVSGIFNLGSGRPTEVRTLIAELLAACGLDANYPIRQLEPTPGDQFTVWADVTAIREALGWEPKTSLREGIARMVAWARAGGC